MRVGTKDLKNNLSRYLRLVRTGERVLIADRRRVVAEIRRVTDDGARDEAWIERLVTEGAVTQGRGRAPAFQPARPRLRRSLARMVIEDRR